MSRLFQSEDQNFYEVGREGLSLLKGKAGDRPDFGVASSRAQGYLGISPWEWQGPVKFTFRSPSFHVMSPQKFGPA